MPNESKVMPFNPDLKKETKHYQVSYHLPKGGERVKLNVSTEHPMGSPAFINQVHLHAKKLGHKFGSVGSTQEIIHTTPEQEIKAPTPHADLAQEFVDSSKKKDFNATKLGKALFSKCADLFKSKNPLKSGTSVKGKVIKPDHKEGDLPDLLDPVLFNKPKSNITEFLEHEDKIKEESEKPKEDIEKADSNPSQYSTPEKFSKEELLAAIRQDIIAELDAVNLYVAHKTASDDPDFNKAIEHIIDEEKEHAKELQEVLDKLGGSKVEKSEKAADFKPGDDRGAPIFGHVTTGKVSYKPYKCTNCGTKQSLQTNHTGNVASHCPGCSWKGSEKPGIFAGQHREFTLDDSEDVKKAIDIEDLDEKSPKFRGIMGNKPGSNAPKAPLMFEYDKPESALKQGDMVEFTSEAGKKAKGQIESVRSEKIHIREDGSGEMHRVPTENVKLAKSELVSYVLSKSISNEWMSDIAKEFEGLAKSYGIDYKYISMPSGILHYDLFKIGNCKVMHKAMGKLIDVKISYPNNSIEEQRSLAKALFYKLLAYYKRDAIAKNYEVYELPDSFGIFESDESLTKACDILKAGKGRSGYYRNRKIGASGSGAQAPHGSSMLDYINTNYRLKLRRKVHPRSYIQKLSPAKRYVQRHNRYLWGAEKPNAAPEAKVRKSLKLTGFGKQMVKAFGVKAPSIKVTIKKPATMGTVKKPSTSLGAPKMAKPISNIKAGPKTTLAAPAPKMATTPKI